jgi:hypothetical protein
MVITKLLATLGLAAAAVSIASSALALNPQPLPPGKVRPEASARAHDHSVAHPLHCRIVHHHRICRR